MKQNSAGADWLKGITILDLSSLLPAPLAAHHLAKFGARVIKIESPNRPDPARNFGYTPAGQTSSVYREINGNKELVWLDLKLDADRAKLYELVRTADSAIQGYRPEVRKRLGIEYATLAAVNPALVYCSVGGYDSAGEYRDRAGHDVNFVARSGILDQTRDREGRCVMPGIPLGDHSVAYAAALRMCCALFAARQSRQGCHIEISIEQALMEIQMPFLREAMESGEMPRSGHTLVTGKYPCYNLYEVVGGTFALGALEEKFWRSFCEAIGRADLIPQHLATGELSRQTIAKVNATLAQKNFTEWWQIFQKIDCCIEPVVTTKDVIHGLQS